VHYFGAASQALRMRTPQMVQFIHQEAQEKAQEIALKAKEEFNIEKLRMVEAEKQKIRQDYERKEKQVEVQKRIEQSNTVRLGRLEALKKRDEEMQNVLAEAAAKLPSLTQQSSYPALLQSLILEVRSRCGGVAAFETFELSARAPAAGFETAR